MEGLERIAQNPAVLQGKACIRGMRVTVGMIVRQIGTETSIEDVLAASPYREGEDLLQAPRDAGMLADAREVVPAVWHHGHPGLRSETWGTRSFGEI